MPFEVALGFGSRLARPRHNKADALGRYTGHASGWLDERLERQGVAAQGEQRIPIYFGSPSANPHKAIGRLRYHDFRQRRGIDLESPFATPERLIT